MLTVLVGEDVEMTVLSRANHTPSNVTDCPFAHLDAATPFDRPDRYALKPRKVRKSKVLRPRDHTNTRAVPVKVRKPSQVKAKNAPSTIRFIADTCKEWEPMIKENLRTAMDLLKKGWGVFGPHAVLLVVDVREFATKAVARAYKYSKTWEFWQLLGGIVGKLISHLGWWAFVTLTWTAESLVQFLIDCLNGHQMKYAYQIQTL
jgi:hypothetical protein